MLSKDLYVGGQSYAGKFVPILAAKIHEAREANETTIPLKGIYLSGPLFMPARMLTKSFDAYYILGAISKKDKQTLGNKSREDRAKFLDKSLHESKATMNMLDRIKKFDLPLDNYVTRKSMDVNVIDNIMRSDRIRSAVHAGNITFHAYNSMLNTNFQFAYLSGVRNKLEILLNSSSYKVLVVSGKYDSAVSIPMVEAALLATRWNKSNEYKSSERKEWRVKNTDGNTEVYGHYSHVDPICRVTIHGAGHNIAHDQLNITRELMIQFTEKGCVG